MRVTFAFFSVEETINFNVVVWDMLRAIERLVRIPANEEGVAHKATFTFKKEKVENFFEGRVLFSRLGKTILVAPELHFKASIVFEPPQGCNLDHIFELLFTEVGKLACVMTLNRVRPDLDGRLVDGKFHPIGVQKSVNDYAMTTTFTMAFFHSFGPDKTEE